ncbi:hypothetical protein PybrP1_006305 [[Pythium] brassicae (nom. inval.)]|nr:hypothetical protein PybrP1_006305 [[Pythium] brassicae (nom. inval.)]
MASDETPPAGDKCASVLDKFLALRKLPPPSSPKHAAQSSFKNTASVAALTRGSTVVAARSSAALAAPAAPVWRHFSKRAHGERVAALRTAMRTPDDGLSSSRDAYNPPKPRRRFVQLHTEEAAVGVDFHVLTRATRFEREPVDCDVCDRLENRQRYDALLRELYSHDFVGKQ